MKISLKELKSNIFQLILFAIACLLLVSFIAFLMSNGKSFDIGKLGSLGDFFGGVLNPIFAFLAFLALLTTIILQASELKATRKELRKSARAQKKQSKSLKLQNKATKLQMFENTFFQLLNQHNEYLDLVIKEKIKIEYIKYTHGGIYNELREDGLKPKNEILSVFRNINQTNRALKNYFMTLFQILKYIDGYAKRNDINAKFYTNIIRALIDDEILRLLAINCVAYPEFIEYKKYIEEYAFFEHIYLDESIKEIETILEILVEYKLGAFDKNKGIITLLNKEN